MLREELIDVLMERKGAFFVSIVAETLPSMRKTGNPFVGCTKKVHVNGMLNWIYSNAVNNQRAREENTNHFEPHPRTWGNRIRREDNTYTPFVKHTTKDGINKLYLELKVEKYISEEYFLNDTLIAKSDIEPFLTEKFYERQELRKVVLLRDYDINNVKQITFDNQTLLLT